MEGRDLVMLGMKGQDMSSEDQHLFIRRRTEEIRMLCMRSIDFVGCAMDVIFETSNGKFFAMEIGFFDTVLDIKEKVQKHQGFPVAAQKLVFRGQEMADALPAAAHYQILHNSCIHLTLASSSGGDRRIKLLVNIPAARRHLVMEADRAESVGRLRDRVCALGGVPPGCLALLHGGVELAPEYRQLAECGVGDGSKVSVALRAPQAAAAALRGGARPPMTVVMVLPLRPSARRVPVEVNAAGCVGELRMEVQKLHCAAWGYGGSCFPMDGYFFIYGRNAMDEEKSFLWHGVRDGDLIEVFEASICK